ncbi:MAG: hypothetical protein U0984_18030, partial [Prosthecobacter sp.]|nr:hypothetical protein [Prosthecobacter sp.]
MRESPDRDASACPHGRGHSQILTTLRRWSRHAWLLHGWLIASLVLMPFPQVYSEWVDTDSDSTVDSWNDGSTTHSLASLDATSQDIDTDNAYNSEELQYASNPFVFDTDGDGLDDGTEIHVAIQGALKSYSLTSWDSNGDSVSDHDDFYGFMAVTYPGGQLPS